MTQLRVKSPLLHDGQRFEVGDLIDESVLSEGQSDVLLAADILETVEDTGAAAPEAASETPAEPAAPAAAAEAAPAEAEEPAAEEAAETPAEEASEPGSAETTPEA